MSEEKKEEVVETPDKEEKTTDTSSDDKFLQFEEKVTKLLDKWGTEIGNERKEREDLLTKLGSIEEKLSSREEQETEFDPYDKEQLSEMFRSIVQEEVNPLKEGQTSYLTQEALTNILQNAANINSLKSEFKLKDKEVEELTAEAQEKGLDPKLLAYEKYGDRKFKNTNADLADELKKKDTGHPEETALEAEYKKLGISKDPSEFERTFKEKGSEDIKKALMEADKAAGI